VRSRSESWHGMLEPKISLFGALFLGALILEFCWSATLVTR